MISVIMMTLNKANYLAFAVASVMEFDDVELILVSPTEKDHSRTFFPSFTQLYGNRIRFILTPDSSPAEGLNNALVEVRGDIVGILNGDDFYLPGSLSFVHKQFELSSDLDLFLGGGLIVDQELNLVKHVIPGNVKYVNRFQDNQGVFTFLHQAMFYRIAKFKELRFNEENRKNWDTEFLTTILRQNPKILITKRAIAAFRLLEDNITSQNHSNTSQKIRQSCTSLIFSPKVLYLRTLALILRTSKFITLIKWAIVCQLKRENYRRR